MSRNASTIQAQIIYFLANNANLTYLDPNNVTRNMTYNTGTRAFWSNLSMCIASAIAYFEQLVDQYVVNIETQISQASAGSSLWIQSKMFQFQWDSSNPQIVQLVDTVPQYPVLDTTLQVITACSVTVDANNIVDIKVATGNPYVKLTQPQLSAAQSYISLIGDAGITYNVSSLTADKLCILANIYYNGQYSAVIQANVIAALNNFLQTLSQTNFNGALKVSDIEGTIRNVTGVNDVVLTGVYSRPDSPAPAGNDPTNNSNGTALIQGSTLYYRQYSPVAGYIVQETLTGYTFMDTLSFYPPIQ